MLNKFVRRPIYCSLLLMLALILLTPNHLPSFAGKVSNLTTFDAPDNVAFFNEEGEKQFLDQYEDKTILLVFWATWCSACTKEIPELDILQKDFRKLPFEIIAVSQDFNGIKIVQEYFKAQGVRHLKIYHDYKNELFKAMSVVGIPSSFLINTNGKVIMSFTGTINWHDDEIRRQILSHIPGNHPEPKNSYRKPSLNQKLAPASNEQEKSDSPAEITTEPSSNNTNNISTNDNPVKEESNK